MSDDNERTRVIILTANYRIEGKISLVPNARVTDFVLKEDRFIVVTDAEVMDKDGNVILTSSFLNVHKERVEVIMPVALANPV